MKQAIYAGSFDPFSIGHLEILRRSLEIFDRVHVVVAVNRGKKPMFSESIRVDLIKQSISHLSEKIRERIVVDWEEGYIYQYAEREDIKYFVRGIRNGLDLDYEVNIQEFNWNVSGIDTVYFTPIEHGRVSSSLIREYIKAGLPHMAVTLMSPAFNTPDGKKVLEKCIEGP